jgi:hypothetical protein
VWSGGWLLSGGLGRKREGAIEAVGGNREHKDQGLLDYVRLLGLAMACLYVLKLFL